MQLPTRSEKDSNCSRCDDVEGSHLKRSSRGCLRIQQPCWIWKRVEDVWLGFRVFYIHSLLNQRTWLLMDEVDLRQVKNEGRGLSCYGWANSNMVRGRTVAWCTGRAILSQVDSAVPNQQCREWQWEGVKAFVIYVLGRCFLSVIPWQTFVKWRVGLFGQKGWLVGLSDWDGKASAGGFNSVWWISLPCRG